MEFEVHDDSSGKPRWRLKAGNGQAIASSGESFSSHANAVAAAENFKSQGEVLELRGSALTLPMGTAGGRSRRTARTLDRRAKLSTVSRMLNVQPTTSGTTPARLVARSRRMEARRPLGALGRMRSGQEAREHIPR